MRKPKESAPLSERDEETTTKLVGSSSKLVGATPTPQTDVVSAETGLAPWWKEKTADGDWSVGVGDVGHCLLDTEWEADRLCNAINQSLADKRAPQDEAAMPVVRTALRVLLNHIEPGFENCKTLVELWLNGALPVSSASQTATESLRKQKNGASTQSKGGEK